MTAGPITDRSILAEHWTLATGSYVQKLLEFTGDDLDVSMTDISIEVAILKPSAIKSFLSKPQNWVALTRVRSIPDATAESLREAVRIISDVYYVDEQHPLYPERQKAERALSL